MSNCDAVGRVALTHVPDKLSGRAPHVHGPSDDIRSDRLDVARRVAAIVALAKSTPVFTRPVR